MHKSIEVSKNSCLVYQHLFTPKENQIFEKQSVYVITQALPVKLVQALFSNKSIPEQSPGLISPYF